MSPWKAPHGRPGGPGRPSSPGALAALDVPCPTCEAPRGQRCWNLARKERGYATRPELRAYAFLRPRSSHQRRFENAGWTKVVRTFLERAA